nr:immunoglobulin heavy chain junction region [Homo sapiens]
TSKNQFSLKLS